MNPEKKPLVSLIVVALNAKLYLQELFRDIELQNYPVDKTEIILVDSLSNDGTKSMMEKFKLSHPQRSISIHENHKKILASGWNLGLSMSHGSIIIRVDAHSRLNPNFLRENVTHILRGESIVGGPTLSKNEAGFWRDICRDAESSKFGGSTAKFRNIGAQGYVDSLAYAAYQKNVFQTIGGLHEGLERNQDNELHARIKKAGYRFFYDPKIVSFYKTRNSLRQIFRQKYNNGRWIFPVLSINVLAFSPRHIIPSLFVVSLFTTVLFGVLYTWIPMAMLLALYFSVSLYFASKIDRNYEFQKRVTFILILPIVFAGMHVAYGIGTLAGAILTPKFVLKYREYKIPYPITQKNVSS